MSFFSDHGFMPHVHCYLGLRSLVWTMFTSDFLIGTSYIAISILLGKLIREIKIQFNYLILCFGLFIGACGASHFMEIWTLWHPDYWVAAGLKSLTALASVGTAVYLFLLRDQFSHVAAAISASELDRKRLFERALSLEGKVSEQSEQLSDSENRFRLVADTIPQLAWMINPDGYVTWYNQRWFDYTGATLEEMQGWGWQKVQHPDHADRVTEKWKTHLALGTEWEDTFPLRGKDGKYRWFLSRAMPSRDAAGKITRWFGTNTDITDLREAMRARDTFLTVASHELRTPLTGLSLSTQLRFRDLKKNFEEAFTREKAMKFLSDQEAYISRLNRIIEDLLDVSRLSDGQFRIHRERFKLIEMISDVLERFQIVLENSSVELDFEVNGEIEGNWDRFRLEQLLLNLITNAVRYGRGKPIQIRTEIESGNAVVLVKDQGIGISAEDQKRIFLRYERAISENEVSGLGLGLYIATEIAHAHQGTIEVTSELGRGSEFKLTLPLA